MDKRQYKRVMEQIQMSDACEQRILDAVHNSEMPKPKKHITLRNKNATSTSLPMEEVSCMLRKETVCGKFIRQA